MNNNLFHSIQDELYYATVILPIAVPKLYTYSIPSEMIDSIQVGVRVEVQFGRSKLYAAIVQNIDKNRPEKYRPKPIISIIDDKPIVTEKQLQLWTWIANYYMCTLGEVMNAALPSGLKLASETIITLNPLFNHNYEQLNDKEYLIAEALTIQNELTIKDIQSILNQKTVYPLVKSLLEKHIIFLKEELQQKYKPKTVTCVRLKEPYSSNTELLQEAFDKVKRAGKQTEALMAFVQLNQTNKTVLRQAVCDKANVKTNIIKAIVDKGIFEIYKKETSRIGLYDKDLEEKYKLSEQQEAALEFIKEKFNTKNVVLLHGVTGSGKTRVYIELIQETISKGEQVLYLLPEIALTTQIIFRLQRIFGDDILVYHSRLNNNERVEIWKKTLEGKSVLVGARSSLFLPFINLKLIIVDEEHDPSFKQVEPNPRYNARDTAIFYAYLNQAKVLLGSATPSIETFHNTEINKYGIVKMSERFGGLELPEIVVVNVKEEMKKRILQSHFTSVLIEELKQTIDNGNQAILFQNRRGYAPTLRCQICDWYAECIHCDVSLTFHQYSNNLRCHYCGYQTPIQKDCPACGSHDLTLKGFGTQKVEDELQIYLPKAKVQRMDFDSIRTKNAHTKLINDFEEKRIDILVGTQMVTKGLDFDNVGLVGVLSADSLFQFPDFRASERAFQLMTQVSGRAGRKHKQGKVIIQAMNPQHPVISEVLQNNYAAFYKRELEERKMFLYPPFYRFIKITLKHKRTETLNQAGKLFSKYLKGKVGRRLLGPAVPSIPRVRSYYLLEIMIKIERQAQSLQLVKQSIIEAIEVLNTTKGYSQVKVVVDVDTY